MVCVVLRIALVNLMCMAQGGYATDNTFIGPLLVYDRAISC